jgi:hypothetical protein
MRSGVQNCSLSAHLQAESEPPTCTLPAAV